MGGGEALLLPNPVLQICPHTGPKPFFFFLLKLLMILVHLSPEPRKFLHNFSPYQDQVFMNNVHACMVNGFWAWVPKGVKPSHFITYGLSLSLYVPSFVCTPIFHVTQQTDGMNSQMRGLHPL
jgi:hypothetical protein